MINLNPSQRPTLEVIMRDHWVNVGQSAEMRPYIKPLWDDLNQQVAQIMKTLGYEKHKTQESFTNKKYNNIIGTYCILDKLKMNICGRKIRVRSCSSLTPTSVFPQPRRLGHQEEG